MNRSTKLTYSQTSTCDRRACRAPFRLDAEILKGSGHATSTAVSTCPSARKVLVACECSVADRSREIGNGATYFVRAVLWAGSGNTGNVFQVA
jgi:hypothetical protein